jgi:hypothetical protein
MVQFPGEAGSATGKHSKTSVKSSQIKEMSEKDTTQEGRDPSNKHEVPVKYVKSNFFRVIHADGAWGGISPRGDIHMSFYNERGALPDSGVITVGDEGKIVKPEAVQSSGSLVREIECDVVFDLVTAVGFRKWLDNKISEMNQLIKQAQEEQHKTQTKVKVS